MLSELKIKDIADEVLQKVMLTEAAIKRLIARQSAETIVLATREKLGAASPYRIVPMEELTGLVTEASAGEDALAPFRRPGLDIVTA